MLQKILLSILLLIFSLTVQASNNCFIASENGKVVKEEGPCNDRHPPYSSFKAAIAVMGFDSGILISSDKPKVEYSAEIAKSFAPFYAPQKYPGQRFSARAQTPESWIKYSVVWYSQYITQRLGMEKFQHYVDIFNYGNKNVSGNPGKNDGLMTAWLGTSLKISPKEQMMFMEKLSNKTLPVSQAAQEKAIKILKTDNVWDDWAMYGKTGSGTKEGYFVGWVEKNGQRIVFAQYVDVPDNSLLSGGTIAKELAKNNLISLTLLLDPSQS